VCFHLLFAKKTTKFKYRCVKSKSRSCKSKPKSINQVLKNGTGVQVLDSSTTSLCGHADWCSYVYQCGHADWCTSVYQCGHAYSCTSVYQCGHADWCWCWNEQTRTTIRIWASVVNNLKMSNLLAKCFALMSVLEGQVTARLHDSTATQSRLTISK